ncbi:PPE family domain protein [Mycobacterium kansasii 732]|nr:PPE family domain protein [Mycobacterium kansasii 732]
MTAAAIDIDDGPLHRMLVRSITTARYMPAAECSSAASSSQLAAAARSELDPGPVYIRAEFTSGGNSAKSNTMAPCLVGGYVISPAGGGRWRPVAAGGAAADGQCASW